ncbi:dUTP diphosphatase [Candidatus Woesearchaeota archaeon CG10_big_fil_rev_8_21_14_0_10_45_16]|nr:MAG: dUTP diphosphatase [Candidatus Woesearchaeota archaeon CG10_big_fil_rev_8_21_14_0_10_45_16]
MLKIKKLHPDAVLPAYANPGDAGMDLYANETVEVKPQQRYLVSTGISMAIPHGYVGLIWDKSGIAAKTGLKTMGGVVDSSYRGEVKIIVHNLSQESYLVEKGKKVAQMLIQPVEQRAIVEVDLLEETQRGDGGFGSTGL